MLDFSKQRIASISSSIKQLKETCHDQIEHQIIWAKVLYNFPKE